MDLNHSRCSRKTFASKKERKELKAKELEDLDSLLAEFDIKPDVSTSENREAASSTAAAEEAPAAAAE